MSTSQSPNKAFWRALGLVIGGLTVGILALALLVTASGPRVRNVAVQNQTGERIFSVSQGLTVVFDRPIVGSDFESAIEFDPEVDYTVSHRQGQLSITFDQNLLSNTEYALTIKPEIEDEAGRRMEGEYRYEFTTEEPSFTYLERNYDRGAVDKVIQRALLSGESQILQTSKQEWLIRQIRNGMDGAGIPVECSKGEWSAAQHEINLRFSTAVEM